MESKAVIFKDIVTGEEITFPSVYKAAKFIGLDRIIFYSEDGRIWNNKYKIKINYSVL